MPQQIVQTVFPALVLFILLFVLIFNDRAFPQLVRHAFYGMLIIATILITADGVAYLLGEVGILNGPREINAYITTIKFSFRPFLLMVWLAVILRNNKGHISKLLTIPLIVNLLVCSTNAKTHLVSDYDLDGRAVLGKLFFLPIAIFLGYMALMVAFAIWDARKNDWAELILTVSILCAVLFCSYLERAKGYRMVVDSTLGIGVSLYYFYLAMQEYRRDALTRVLNRHNFNYDLADLDYKPYGLSLIDIDNFKMINDKYGHDKGDEALVKVVNAIKTNLLPGCRIYRYGGDEFAVISQKVSAEDVEGMFEKINEQLSHENFRISYGTVFHKKGEDSKEVLLGADAAMYANKRQIKSEDIWDDMTGLYNLRGFLDELADLKKKTDKENKRICLVSMDIEHLSNINRAYGYTEGNAIIIALSKIVKQSLNPGEFAGHLGSDEFIVAMSLAQDEEHYQKEYMKGIVSAIDNSLEFSEKDYTIELNFGVGYLDKDTEATIEECVNGVLYSKQNNKDNRRKSVFVTEGELAQEYNEEEDKLVVEIIEQNKLRYAFQPIVSAKDGQILAYEALMRSDTEPRVSPLTILKYASKNGKSYDLVKLTFANLMPRLKELKQKYENRRLFINTIPGFLLTEEDFNKYVVSNKDMLDHLVLEITEQRELEDEALQIINSRREINGFSLAIDDFGSGCSNTNSLLRYMPEVIKLDRLLISGIDQNTKKQYFVNSIITFAKTNAMAVLAEGVETEEELRMVIRLGVDFIQGFYTAKPAFEFLDEVPDEVKNTIISEHTKGSANAGRKIYIASTERELSLVHVAMEEYTGITVAVPELHLLGNLDYMADMAIKIKDGLNCRLTIRDVRLNSIDNLPCIEIGEDATLTLVIEGENTLNAKGIHVPEGSSLIVKGAGKLKVGTKGHDCYGIGCGTEEKVGSISFRHSGNVEVSVDGELCAAIGGGIYEKGSGISAESGAISVSVAGVEAVGVGCFHGEIPLNLVDCAITVDFRVNLGSAFGSVYDKQNILFKNFGIKVTGSGSKLSAVGCNHASGGKIQMLFGMFSALFSGQDIRLIGVESGELDVDISHVRLDLLGEGNSVLAVGSMDETATVSLDESATEIRINAATPVVFGAKEEKITITRPKPNIHVNE